MSKVSKNTLYNWFKNGLKPAQEHFWNWMDSFWHKDEQIPTSAVDGLDDYFNGVAEDFDQLEGYAKKDASNLGNEEIEEWQEKLGIENLELTDDKIQLTSEFLLLESDSNQKELNEEIDSRLLGLENEKLKVPTDIIISDVYYPYVVAEDGAGETARILAEDLDRHIGKTDLILTGPRNLDTDGKPLAIKALPDKRADATFNELLGKNSSDELARVGYAAFKAQAEGWTQNQRDEFAQILNGGFSTGTMSVNLISPPVFELENNDLYVVLRGANLALHPTNRKIEILDAGDNSVLAEVPNNQISIATANNLVFYYNFHSLGAGTYRLKITNGAATYITTRTFEVVSSVDNIDLSGNTFDLLTSYANTLSYSTNDMVYFENEINGTANSTPIFSAKSAELFEQGDEWYLELQVECSMSTAGAEIDTRIGIGYSNTANQLVFSSLNYFYLRSRSNASLILWGVKNVATSSASQPFPTANIVFIKQGNILTVISGEKVYTENLSNNSGYSIFFQAPNRVPLEKTSIQIVKAYKF